MRATDLAGQLTAGGALVLASTAGRLTHGVILLGEVAGALAAVLALLAIAWRILRRLVALQSAMATVERRTGELEHNGGSTIKDQSSQTCARLGALEGAVAGTRAEVATVRLDVATVAARLERHLMEVDR